MGKPRNCGIRGTDRKPELITDNNPQPSSPTTRQNRINTTQPQQAGDSAPLKNKTNKVTLNREGDSALGERFYTPPPAVPGTTPTFPPSQDKNTLPKPIKPPKSRNNQATGRAIQHQEGENVTGGSKRQNTSPTKKNGTKITRQNRIDTTQHHQPDKGSSATPCTSAKHEHQKNQHSKPPTPDKNTLPRQKHPPGTV